MTPIPPDKKALIESFRAAAHRQVDQWVDQQAEMLSAQKIPTLRQMSDQFMQTRTTLLGGCLQEMAIQLSASYRQQDLAPCPHCGKSLKRHSLNAKTLHTLQGSITLERPYFYCRTCKAGFYPLDEALELAHEAYQYDMREKMLRLGIESPYAISADLFKELTGISPYHCAEHVHKVAKLQYGDTLDAQQWAEATITRLFMDQTGLAIGGLKRMQPSGMEADKEIRKLLNYLATHKHRLDYQDCKDTGLPIGSGGIESANKHICHVRLKRSGAWWLEENGNTMLRLRCALYNDTFDTVLNSYIAKKRLRSA